MFGLPSFRWITVVSATALLVLPAVSAVGPSVVPPCKSMTPVAQRVAAPAPETPARVVSDADDIDDTDGLDELEPRDRRLAESALAAKGSFVVRREVRTIRHRVVTVLHGGAEHVVVVSSRDTGDCHACSPSVNAVRFVGDATTPVSISAIRHNGEWGKELEAANISLITVAGKPALVVGGFESGGGTWSELAIFYRLQGRRYRPLGTFVVAHDNQAAVGKEDPSYTSWNADWTVSPDGALTLAYTVDGAGRDQPRAFASRRFPLRGERWALGDDPVTP